MATNFSAVSPSMNLTPSVLAYSIIGSVDHIISIPVNCWALWLIVSGNKSLFQAEFLTLHLVCCELVFSLCFFLSLACSFFQLRLLNPLRDFYHGGSVGGRALFQCHICVDRYLAVVYPLFFIRYKKIKYRGVCLAAVWVAVLAAGLSNSFSPMNLSLVTRGSSYMLAPALVIELFCSLSILRILRRPGPGHKETHERKEGNQQKMRAMKIIGLALAMLIFNVTPFLALGLYIKLGKVSDMIAIAFTLSSVGSSAQAVLFLSRAGKLPCGG